MPIIQTNKPLRKRDPNDFYPTPLSLCKASLELLPKSFKPAFILDPGAGTGVWGQAARDRWEHAYICGIELRDTEEPEYYDTWFTYDYIGFRLEPYDLVVGNPPYRQAEEFIRQSINNVVYGGYIIFLLRTAFLNSQSRVRGLWKQYPPQIVAPTGKRPSFTGDGKTDATDYSIYIWQKGCYDEPIIRWLDWR